MSKLGDTVIAILNTIVLVGFGMLGFLTGPEGAASVLTPLTLLVVGLSLVCSWSLIFVPLDQKLNRRILLGFALLPWIIVVASFIWFTVQVSLLASKS